MATLRTVITQGKISFFIEDSNDYEEGAAMIRAAVSALEKQGIKLEDSSGVESHRDKDGRLLISHHAHH